ncbi:thioredoxin family protein [Halocynthiibacter styelae]|uniref:Thioredoxin family protein n=1 Tax=Halocynthiibacter styelae TaxID=2761955 RepID=A0A8J7LQ62_9RHOB|nr:thioredoxin family protein [Paenihalocynthiibacter styelae]MBI1493877.1 thioredoxin family protein [Paenihalocynthiibacter styelae]
MNRRTFLMTTAAAALMPALASATQNYTPGLVDELLAEGKTVFIDFKTDWCTTCAAQERVIGGLLSNNPEYAENIAFVNVDWDNYADDDLSIRLRIPRRSTLVVLKGEEELGRIVAGTSRSQIQALMDTALTAAKA